MNFPAEETPRQTISTEEASFERGAVFDDLDIRVRSREFRGGTLTAVMCGVTVDLRQAALSPEGATISMQSAMGGVRVLVPRDWDVVCEVDVVWGGYESERFPPPANERGPRLRLTGMVVAGGLCVR